jgi:hypothetical protein
MMTEDNAPLKFVYNPNCACCDILKKKVKCVTMLQSAFRRRKVEAEEEEENPHGAAEASGESDEEEEEEPVPSWFSNTDEWIALTLRSNNLSDMFCAAAKPWLSCPNGTKDEFDKGRMRFRNESARIYYESKIGDQPIELKYQTYIERIMEMKICD